MWEIGNRGFVALASAFSGCVFLYNVWGPILILTISLLLTIYACYSLIINDSLLSPHAFILFDYCKHFSFEVCASFEGIVDHAYQYIRRILEAANRRFRKRYLTPSRMERRRGSRYELSSDSYPTRREPPPNSGGRFYQRPSSALYNHSPFAKMTSTPIYRRNKEEFENRTFDFSATEPEASTPSHRRNHVSTRQEDATYRVAEGSSWGASVSPKAVPTVGEKRGPVAASGPLLSSTRYNIDPKIYSDASSPGLAGRLTKYATDADVEPPRQARYRVGQFPKVNLHPSPVPVINVKSVKTRTPITVRVAPPNAVRYSPPSKQKILADLHRSGDGGAFSDGAQAAKEISLKRHASRENVASDLAKKQRTDGLAGKEAAEAQDETKQKRSREEPSKSEEDASPRSKSVRPTKRTKTPSCYDIINSLSSSRHVVSGVKRKARDFSRSGTPDFEKHFKSLEPVHNASTQTLPQLENVSPKHRPMPDSTGRRSDASAGWYGSAERMPERSPLKGILKSGGKVAEDEPEKIPSGKGTGSRSSGPSPVASTESVGLARKLFMRAEPERNEKLRMLVEEQGSIRAKFTSDDAEEIKREDIADMRQTSMKARLQSMFDAISGKAASRINPDVVIQAEDANSEATKTVESAASCASLASTTTTTDANATPISTSAVAPSPPTAEANVKSPKHVTFALPAGEASSAPLAPRPVAVSSSSGSVAAAASAAASIASRPIVSSAPADSTAKDLGGGKPVPPTSGTGDSSARTTFAFDAAPRSASSVTSAPLAAPTVAGSLGNAADGGSMPSGLVPAPGSGAPAAPTATPSIPSSSSAPFGSSFTSPSTLASSMTFTPVVGAGREQRSAAGAGFACLASTATATPTTSAAPSGANAFAPSSMPGNGAARMFAFGSKTESGTTASTSKPEPLFSFGSAATSSAPFGSAGTAVSVPATSSTGTPKSATVAAASAESAPSPATSGSGFGAPAGAAFAFRGTLASSTASDAKPVFSFGSVSSSATSAASTTSAASATAGGFAFGAGQTAGATPTFGGTPTSSTGAGAGAGAGAAGAGTGTGTGTSQFVPNATSIFASATSAQSIFGSTGSGPQAIFGAAGGTSGTAATPSTSFAIPKSTSTAVAAFGATSVSSGTESLFAGTSTVSAASSGAANPNPAALFGSGTSTVSSGMPGAGSSLFAAATSAATTSTSSFSPSSSIFGQASAPAAPSFRNGPAGIFGSGATLFGTQTSGPAAAKPSISSGATFGAAGAAGAAVTASTTASAGPAQTGFGSVASPASAAFAAQPKTNPGEQSSGSQAFAGGASIFGSSSAGAPVFGAGTGQAPGQTTDPAPFGALASNPSAFAGQNGPSSSAFGVASAAPASTTFGDASKASPFGAQPSSFGGSGGGSTGPIFGAAPPSSENSGTSGAGTGTSASGIFSFGANQKPGQQGVFSFGAGSGAAGAASTASSSAPFQFGATASTNSGTGFNFSAAPATPSIGFGTTTGSGPATFNASTPGIFSIGSGSTAPRSRSVRSRKPR